MFLKGQVAQTDYGFISLFTDTVHKEIMFMMYVSNFPCIKDIQTCASFG